MDVDTVLVSLAERDKWRQRLTTLQRALSEVRVQKRRAELRRRKLAKEIRRLDSIADGLAPGGSAAVTSGGSRGEASPPLQHVR